MSTQLTMQANGAMTDAQGINPATYRPPIGKDVRFWVWLFAIALMVSAPIFAYLVFYHGADKVQMAYANFWLFDFCLIGTMLLPWLPFKSIANFTTYQRLSLMVQFWIVAYILVAITFEIPWLFGWKFIGQNEDKMWAYPWWAYINGGDKRYLDPPLSIIISEASACINAAVAAVCLYVWFKSKKTSPMAVHFLMFGACAHIWPTIQYYFIETYDGFPNVNVHAAGDFWAKFIISNGSWLVMPFFVLIWGVMTLRRIYTGRPVN